MCGNIENMNREIKFRIWDTKEKRFYVDDTVNHRLPADETYQDDISSFFYCLKFVQRNDRFVLQQFTGLKDENGKEIYDGDILAWKNPNDGEPVTVSIKQGQIFFDNSPAVWALGCVFGTDHYNECGLPDILNGLKVIGNIFETVKNNKQNKRK